MYKNKHTNIEYIKHQIELKTLKHYKKIFLKERKETDHIEKWMEYKGDVINEQAVIYYNYRSSKREFGLLRQLL